MTHDDSIIALIWVHSLTLQTRFGWVYWPPKRKILSGSSNAGSRHKGKVCDSRAILITFYFSLDLFVFLSSCICSVLSWFHVSTTTLLVLVIAKVRVLFLRLKETVKRSAGTYRCRSILMRCDNCEAFSSRSRVQMSHMSFSHRSPTRKPWLEKHQWCLLVCSCECAQVCQSVCICVVFATLP